jgi:hypothetical protein
MFNDVLEKIAKETDHKLTMRTGWAFGRADASISGVSPHYWPANGFLQAAHQGVFHASSVFHSVFVFSNHCWRKAFLSEMDVCALECDTFSEQLKSVGDVMQWTLPCDIDTLSNARVNTDASEKAAYAFLDSVNKLICLYMLEFPASKVCY